MMRGPRFLLVLTALVLPVGPAVAVEVVTGKIKAIVADKNQFVVADSRGKETAYTLADTGKVRTAAPPRGANFPKSALESSPRGAR
jgi:hypothetical protein